MSLLPNPPVKAHMPLIQNTKPVHLKQKVKTAHTYKPIAPAPATPTAAPTLLGTIHQPSNHPAVISPTAIMLPPSAANHLYQQPAVQPTSYLTQGSNGAMYLVTNPAPTVPSPITFLSGHAQSGALQFAFQQQPTTAPITILSGGSPHTFFHPTLSSTNLLAQQTTPLLQLNSSFANHLHGTSTSIMMPNSFVSTSSPSNFHPSLISTFTNAQVNQGPLITGCGTSSQPLCAVQPSMPPSSGGTLVQSSSTPVNIGEDEMFVKTTKSAELTTTKLSVEISTDISGGKGSKTDSDRILNNIGVGNSNQKITFESGNFNDDTVTYKNKNGNTVKLDILERAILEIPDLVK